VKSIKFTVLLTIILLISSTGVLTVTPVKQQQNIQTGNTVTTTLNNSTNNHSYKSLVLKTNPSIDTDGDGLSNSFEFNHSHLNAYQSDTDGDGLTDEKEILYNTLPNESDSDSDGVTDYNETIVYQTKPNSIDTDGDGLNDSLEINHLQTDPTKIDTDGDSVPDNIELKYGTNPQEKPDCLNSTSKERDSDLDGLSDRKECLYGMDIYDSDTDNDGLRDGAEFDNETVYGVALKNSSPVEKDLHIIYSPTHLLINKNSNKYLLILLSKTPQVTQESTSTFIQTQYKQMNHLQANRLLQL